METLEEQKQSKVPLIRIDESLNEYDGRILFPKKLAEANETLRTIGVPKTAEKPKE